MVRRAQILGLYVLSVVLVATAGPAGASEQPAGDPACAGAKATVVDAYVDGLWRQNDADAVRRGFHPGFVLQVLADGELLSVGLEDWLARLELDGEPNPEPVEAEVELLDCAATAAVVKVELYEGGEHLYTDHLSLYRLDDGWRIVAKTFHSHG